MASLKPVYAAEAGISGTSLNALANGATGTSDAVDNGTNRYQDYLINVYIDGTAAAAAYLEVRASLSCDGTNYSLWDSAIPLGTIQLSTDLQRGIFSLVGHGNLFTAPEDFKIMVKNNTGAALHATNSYVRVQGIYTEAA